MSKGTVKQYSRNIHAYFTAFGYWNRMRFIPEFFPVKTVCSLGNWGKYDEDAIGNVEMDAKSKKAMHSIGFIKQYEEFAVTARDGGEFGEGEQKLPGSMAMEISLT